MREKPGKAGRQVRAFVIESPPVRVDERRRLQILLEVRHAHTHGEALTRLSKVFGVMEFARISGHRDLRVLQNVYFAPSVKDLSDKLD